MHIEQQTTSKNPLPKVILRLFQKRGMTHQDIKEFLSWDLRKLPDLTGLIDLEKATDRIIDAIRDGEKIAIYGDYDVDGTTSCALFYHFFKMLDIEIDLIQPSRFVEGYGIHPPTILEAKEKGVTVLITVDCGITNSEAADTAREHGVDLIITDHHKDAKELMPNAYAIVNPNRRDEDLDSPKVSLAGVAVAFCLALKIKQKLEAEQFEIPSIYPLLQFVAIGTICDLAKLNPMNLKLVRHGLRQIQEQTYPGINVFFTLEERKRFVPSEKLSFQLGPMINSKGRLDHPRKALELLICDNPETAFELYSHLDVCNKERKFIQAEVVKEAKEQVLNELKAGENVINIVYAPHWHEGVIGIVASRLVEEFKVPAIVLCATEDKTILKGSARSAGELDIFDELQKCNDLFLKFGGHKAAAGLSFNIENLPDLKERMHNSIISLPEIHRTVQDYYDLEITAEEINPELLRSLEMLEPFGMGNSKPIFRMKHFKVDSYKVLKDVHIKWNLSSKRSHAKLQGISFNYLGKFGIQPPKELCDMQRDNLTELTAYFTLGINHFNGNKYIQLMINKIEI